MSVRAARTPGVAARLLETPAGLMIVEATAVGVSRLQQVDESELHAADAWFDVTHGDGGGEDDDEDLDRGPGGAGGHLDRLTGQVRAYLAGELHGFDVPLDWAAAGVHDEFSREVYREIQRIPYGETSTYGQISVDAGRPRNARRVGRLCSIVPVPFVIPVHRVIRADGGMGNCPEYRLRLLEHERRNVAAARRDAAAERGGTAAGIPFV
ncbi:methylated-DNA--[protein]-cysteine S-methyltransferase [Dietzia cinnamea]|uniref:methylated-DNA--[protein]-cysteine S-methyltransferase n=1 Tax=Dietzia cinnamea TaxID=321318 RepID=UPI0021A3C891|nr:methylated-DNA--[protein]-cysteine S-methyltransferase [Dietzia cinnamea]MCT2058645.1 methylated-DNA--[protein]-cysteine S-methyltransferase [Dietzia cinnamea]MCT2140027.1 methylated-DNA--[protein]-cysteine S-methyltransferase [Dietzia cinnamea]